MSGRMTDERLVELRGKSLTVGVSKAELLDALQAERDEVERMATAYVDLAARYHESEAEVARLRARLDVLDRQEWFRRSLGEAGSSEGWTIEAPETDEAAADLRLLLGMEDGK